MLCWLRPTNDGEYVHLRDRPLNMLTAWIALEDIHPGSGELLYVPGSHRFGRWVVSSP